MKKIIIDSIFSTHQKSIILFVFLLISIFTYFSLEFIISNLLADRSFNQFFYLSLLFIPLSAFLFCLLFSKQVIITTNNELFYCQFIFGKAFMRKKIPLLSFDQQTILASNFSQKFAFFTSVQPDRTETNKLHRLFLLNSNHSQRILVLSTYNSKHVDSIAQGLLDAFDLKLKKYSPPRSKNRRR